MASDINQKEREKKKERQYKFTSWFVEFCGWMAMCFLFVAIWVDDYRWKFIASGLFFFILACILYNSLPKKIKDKIE